MLEILSVDKPCDAEFEGDFCPRCSKQVHDLSSLTRRQAEQLISEAPGPICARFKRRADGTVVTLAAMLLASGDVHADLAATRGKKQAVKPPVKTVPVGELIEHVPKAPEDTSRTIMGELNVRAVRPKMDAIKRCYEKVLRRAPNVMGRLSLRLKVVRGRVESVEVHDSNLDDAELEKCVLDAARSWQFAESEETITITYPFNFQPGP